METKVYRAAHRFARIEPRKARWVAKLVRGMPVNAAIATLDHEHRRGASLIKKVIQSALANASNDMEADLEALVVSDCHIDTGPLLGGRPRWLTRAHGRATPIWKRTAHLCVGLREDPARRKRRAAAAPAAGEAEGRGEEEGANPSE
jgi:large subunit ribosomal protein L22